MCPRKYAGLLAGATLIASVAVAAEPPPRPTTSTRWDFALELPSWPSLEDLEPEANGAFDATGFGLGGSWHWTAREFETSDLMLGFDGWVSTNDSNIQGAYEVLTARQAYFGMSVKWRLGSARNLSLDTGAGYHHADIVQLDSGALGYLEYESWSNSAAGGFVGVTWDIAAGRPGKSGGLFIGLRVHFVDLGRVYDDGTPWYSPMLGPDAGSLEGPLYMLRIGYSGRR